MNLDWIVGRIKNVETSEANAKASEEAAKDSEDAAKASEEAAKASEEAAEDSANSAAQNASNIANSAAQISENSARIDNLIANAGDGTIPSELVDIRTSYYGYTYSTAGTAVRSQASKPAPGDVITEELENRLDDITSTTTGAVKNTFELYPAGWGWVRLDGTIRADTNTLVYTDYIHVNEGDLVTVNGTRGMLRFVAAFDSAQNAISASGAESVYRYVVPSGIAYIRITVYTENASDIDTTPTYNIVSMGNKRYIGYIPNITVEKTGSFSKIDTVSATFGYRKANGTVISDPDGILAYTPEIPVNEGDVLTSLGVRNSNIRFVCAINDMGTVVPANGSDNVLHSYTVPAGITGVILTLYVDTPGNIDTFPDIHHEKTGAYYLPITDDTFESTAYPASANSIANIGVDIAKDKSIRKAGSMASGEQWSFEENNISVGKTLDFSANITTFSAVEMGHGISEAEGNYIRIDGTDIKMYLAGSLRQTVAHGLSIANTLQVKIVVKTENAYKAYITVCSNGNEFETEVSPWYGDSGILFVKSVGSTFSHAAFGWTCNNYTCPVWIYGDSYLGYATNNRWAYYLVRDGYEQLLDGYGGRRTRYAYESLKLAITHGTPKYIFWPMGMNDPDNGAVNDTWLEYTEKMLDLCKKQGIIPILATIPNVSASNHDNTYKNAWVKASGYRYVDMAAAVNAESAGATWYSGMLSEDGTHPNPTGAATLYYQVLADFPEITNTRK